MKHQVLENVLYIYLEGRIDASNATSVESEILDIRNANLTEELILDAEKLEYISSAGLRIVLRLKKLVNNMKIINVSTNVYEILEMTGFTDIVDVVKAFRKLSVDGCEIIGQGANGIIYRYDEETIVKVFFNLNALNEIKNERELARKAFVLGINTAIPYDVVRVGEGYGYVSELLNAASLSKLVAKNASNFEEEVNMFVDLLKKIHSVTLKDNEVPNMKEIVIGWTKFLEEYLPIDEYQKLYNLVINTKETNNLLHGDYHTNNVMVQEGETLLIDMDTLCMGNPVFELASMYNAFVGFNDGNGERSMSFFGFNKDVSYAFWRKSLELYLNTNDEEKLNEVESKAKVVGYTRLLRRAIRREADTELGQKLIAIYKERLHDLLQVVTDLNF